MTAAESAKLVEEEAGYCLAALGSLLHSIDFSSKAIYQQFGGSFTSADAAGRICPGVHELRSASDRLRDFGGELWESWELAVAATGEGPIEIGDEECLSAWEATLSLALNVELLVGKYHIGEWSSETPDKSEPRRQADCHRLATAAFELAPEALLDTLCKRIRRECLAFRASLAPKPVDPVPAESVYAPPLKQKKRWTADEANAAARPILRGNPGISLRGLAEAIGCSSGLVPKLPAWIAVQEARSNGRTPKRAPSGDSMLDIADVYGNVTSHAQQASAEESEASLDQLIDEQEADYEKSPLE